MDGSRISRLSEATGEFEFIAFHSFFAATGDVKSAASLAYTELNVIGTFETILAENSRVDFRGRQRISARQAVLRC